MRCDDRPGRRTIPSTTLWVVPNILEFGLAPRQAVAAPRTHHPWSPDVLTSRGPLLDPPPATPSARRAIPSGIGGPQVDVHSIVIEPATGTRHGATDRRKAAVAPGD
ncbi:MAG TPA: hypothetical protein VKP69_30420 [Isosphaeraceae bacterium]|nr:hypothetical protein [Isosphaeraceae bacterium]